MKSIVWLCQKEVLQMAEKRKPGKNRNPLRFRIREYSTARIRKRIAPRIALKLIMLIIDF